MKLTKSTPMSTNFKANIKSTKYLQEGLKTAARNIETNPKRAQAFYDSLNIILKSKTFQNFSIIARKGSKLKPGTARPSVIKIDNYNIEREPFFGLIYDGEQCVERVNDFTKNFLGRKPAETYLSKEELMRKGKFFEELISLGVEKFSLKHIKGKIKDLQLMLKSCPKENIEEVELIKENINQCNEILRLYKRAIALEKLKS